MFDEVRAVQCEAASRGYKLGLRPAPGENTWVAWICRITKSDATSGRSVARGQTPLEAATNALGRVASLQR